MFSTKLTTMSSADLYEYTAVNLASLDKLKQAHEAIKILKMMASRPIIDTDLANLAQVTLSTLRSTLASQTSADFWYDNFADANGEIAPEDMISISEIIEERRMQVSFIEATLDRLSLD